MSTTGNETNGRAEKKLRRPTGAERERILSDWNSSGRTLEEMAAATGWSTHTIYRWRTLANQGERKRRKKTMLSVPPPARPSPESWTAEVVIGAGTMNVRLSAGCAPGWAGELVRELKSCSA